jgi:hypothetical protein
MCNPDPNGQKNPGLFPGQGEGIHSSHFLLLAAISHLVALLCSALLKGYSIPSKDL